MSAARSYYSYGEDEKPDKVSIEADPVVVKGREDAGVISTTAGIVLFVLAAGAYYAFYKKGK